MKYMITKLEKMIKKKLNNLNFTERVKLFTNDHLGMIRALYNLEVENDTLINDILFERISLFLEQQWEILRIKMDTDISSKVKIHAEKVVIKYLESQNKDITYQCPGIIDTNIVLKNLLHNKCRRISKILQDITLPFLKLLVIISKEIKKLYNLLNKKNNIKHKEQFSSQHNMEVFGLLSFNSNELKKKLQSDQEIERIKSKIQLWRSLYQTVSSCIL